MSASSSQEKPPLRILGVCGGIASGKSAACKMLVSDLACVAHIDTDSIAHNVYQPKSAVVAEVVREFGNEILVSSSDEQEIDRKKLGAIVFADPSAMKRLEAIVWPHVQAEIQKQIAQLEKDWHVAPQNDKVPVVVVEAAVLLDAGWQDSFLDGVWVITVPHDVAVSRMMEHRGLSKEEAEKRLAAQVSRRGIGNVEEEVKNKVVTATIENSGTEEDLKKALSARLHDEEAWYPHSKAKL